MNDWKEDMRLREEKKDRHLQALAPIFEDMDIVADSDVLAEMFMKNKCPYLWVQFIAEKLWGKYIKKHIISDLERIYEEFVDGEHFECSPYEFNDLDDCLYLIPHNKYKIIHHRTQSATFLYIWSIWGKFGELHIRQIYPKYEDLKEKSHFVQEDDNKYNSIKDAIVNADRLAREYADDYEDNRYPNRLSLETYIKKDFTFGHAGDYKLGYGDCRDKGYILSWDALTNSVDRAYQNSEAISFVCTCLIPSIVKSLSEE